jgi:uncharacterized protein (UPF0548 family)
VISLTRPSQEKVEKYRMARIGAAPTALPSSEPPAGFHHARFTRVIGSGSGDFELAKDGLERWVAHRRSGIEVFPPVVGLDEGSTVVLLTRQVGLWVLAACRVVSVIDEPTRFGFIYATLPDHPECGFESFVITTAGAEVTFDIEAVSRPGVALVRLVAPVGRALQRRASDAYLDAMQEWVAT